MRRSTFVSVAADVAAVGVELEGMVLVVLFLTVVASESSCSGGGSDSCGEDFAIQPFVLGLNLMWAGLNVIILLAAVGVFLDDYGVVVARSRFSHYQSPSSLSRRKLTLTVIAMQHKLLRSKRSC